MIIASLGCSFVRPKNSFGSKIYHAFLDLEVHVHFRAFKPSYTFSSIQAFIYIFVGEEVPPRSKIQK